MTGIRFIIKTLNIILLIFIYSCAVKKHTPEYTETSPPAIRYDYLWAIKDKVNIRANSSADSPEIGSLNNGDSVIVIANKNGWYQIRTESNKNGWIRSDLLGPQNLSIYPKAVDFADSIKTSDNVDLFFDKRLQHRRIYLTFPTGLYTNRDYLITESKKIGADYQKKVYSGDISVVLLQPGSEEIFNSFDLNGLVNSEAILPVIPFGKIIDAQLAGKKAKLTYIVEEQIPGDKFITTARKMAGTYPISYSEIVLAFLDENKNCRFWYKEDGNGEIFKFDSCP